MMTWRAAANLFGRSHQIVHNRRCKCKFAQTKWEWDKRTNKKKKKKKRIPTKLRQNAQKPTKEYYTAIHKKAISLFFTSLLRAHIFSIVRCCVHRTDTVQRRRRRTVICVFSINKLNKLYWMARLGAVCMCVCVHSASFICFLFYCAYGWVVVHARVWRVYSVHCTIHMPRNARS